MTMGDGIGQTSRAATEGRKKHCFVVSYDFSPCLKKAHKLTAGISMASL